MAPVCLYMLFTATSLHNAKENTHLKLGNVKIHWYIKMHLQKKNCVNYRLMHFFCGSDSSDKPPVHGLEGCFHRLHCEVRENEE